MMRLSELIDAGTVTRKIIVSDGLHKKRASGWLACVIGNKLVELFMYFNAGGNYIVYRGESYQVDTPCKPITGAFQVSHLKGYY
jgi:hypothetical protein